MSYPNLKHRFDRRAAQPCDLLVHADVRLQVVLRRVDLPQRLHRGDGLLELRDQLGDLTQQGREGSSPMVFDTGNA